MDAAKEFLHEVRDALGAYPMWQPSDPIELGDYGTFFRGVFRKKANLTKLGLVVTPREQKDRAILKQHRGISFNASADLDARTSLIDASLGVNLSIEREYAWAFGARESRIIEFEDMLDVESAIRDINNTGAWDGDWLVVTEVRRVKDLRVVVAKSKGVSGRMSGEGKIPQADDILVAADAKIEFAADGVYMLSAPEATPLFRLCKLKGIFRKDLTPIAYKRIPEAAKGDLLETPDSMEAMLSMFPAG